MKKFSKTSTALRAPDRRTHRTLAEAAPTPRNRRREPFDWFAPPEPRRRKRDAALWVDALTVYTTNRLRDRWPGQRLLTVREGFSIHQAAHARLEARDPELFRAVRWIEVKRSEERMAAVQVSYAAWQAHVHKNAPRLSKMHTRFRPPGPEPHLRAVYWRFVRATSFLTAEVAERQTR
jgi:hypothetical protein